MTDKTDYKAALDVCHRWLRHIEQQKQNTETLQRAAAMARKGDREGAMKLKNKVDNQPRVFDGANFIDFMPTIQEALEIADRVQSGEISDQVVIEGAIQFFETHPKVEDIYKAMTAQLLKEARGE